MRHYIWWRPSQHVLYKWFLLKYVNYLLIYQPYKFQVRFVCQASHLTVFLSSLDARHCPAHHSNHRPIKSIYLNQVQLLLQFEILCIHWLLKFKEPGGLNLKWPNSAEFTLYVVTWPLLQESWSRLNWRFKKSRIIDLSHTLFYCLSLG